MDIEKLRKYYGRCDPYESLGPDDPMNVDIDSYGSDDGPVRGKRWSTKLARQIELSSGKPVCTYFSGLGGSGKTTELRRLVAHLESAEGGRWLPVLANAEDLLDLRNPIDVPDILLVLLHAAEQEVARKENKPLPIDAAGAGSTRLWELLNRYIEINKGEIGFQLPGFNARLIGDIRANPQLRQRVRSAISAHMRGFVEEVHQELTILDNRARNLDRPYAGIVIILDSMEKLRGISTNFEEVIRSAERVFDQDAPWLRLPVHLIYTIPPAVAHLVRVNVEYMPMIKIMGQHEVGYAPGIEAARSVVRSRIPDDDLKRILGPDMEKRVGEIILRSGGSPRELIRLLRLILEFEPLPPSDAAFKRILTHAGEPLRTLVESNWDKIEWLATVRKRKNLPLDTEAHRMAASLMLANNVILQYMNGSRWSDLHPAVRDIPELKQAITRIEV